MQHGVWMAALFLISMGTASAAEPAATGGPVAQSRPAAPSMDPWYRRPYAAIRVIGGGSPDMFGASASLYIPRPFVFEGGISRGIGNRGSWYARGGPALSLREKRDASDIAYERKNPDERYPAADVLVQPMAGFRWSESRIEGVTHTASGPTLTVAVDVMVWLNAKTALDFQVTIGGDYWLENTDPDALAFMPDVHLAAGFAF